MWVAQKVICTLYHLSFGMRALFSAKSVTGCELANTKYVRTEQQAPVNHPEGSLPATYRPFPELPQLLRPSDISHILSSNSPFFHFLAKNSLAIRCSSSRTNGNIQVCLCLPSVLSSLVGSAPTPGPSPGGAPSARRVHVCCPSLTLCHSAPLAGVSRHLSVSVRNKGPLVKEVGEGSAGLSKFHCCRIAQCPDC